MKIRNIIVLILAAVMVLVLFAGCGSNGETAPAPTEAPKAVSVPPVKSANANDNAPIDSEVPKEPEEAFSAEKLAAADCIGKDVESLYEAVGYPLSSEYAPSCLGSGEDGELKYDGFTVYTYKEGSSETVQSVE